MVWHNLVLIVPTTTWSMNCRACMDGCYYSWVVFGVWLSTSHYFDRDYIHHRALHGIQEPV